MKPIYLYIIINKNIRTFLTVIKSFCRKDMVEGAIIENKCNIEIL